jgi:uncharacterized phiE125 gp8 family phage protein
MEPRLITAPTNPAVFLEAFKSLTRVEHPDEDGLIANYLDAATKHVEGWNGVLGKALITQTWQFDFDCFPSVRRLDLPFGPVQSVTVLYSDADNTEQTQAASRYALHEDEHGPFLWLDKGQDSWPDTYDRQDAVRITAVLGYGDNPTDIPGHVRLAIMHIAAHWLKHREPMTTGAEPKQLPLAGIALLQNEQNIKF